MKFALRVLVGAFSVSLKPLCVLFPRGFSTTAKRSYHREYSLGARRPSRRGTGGLGGGLVTDCRGSSPPVQIRPRSAVSSGCYLLFD